MHNGNLATAQSEIAERIKVLRSKAENAAKMAENLEEEAVASREAAVHLARVADEYAALLK